MPARLVSRFTIRSAQYLSNPTAFDAEEDPADAAFADVVIECPSGPGCLARRKTNIPLHHNGVDIPVILQRRIVAALLRCDVIAEGDSVLLLSGGLRGDEVELSYRSAKVIEWLRTESGLPTNCWH